MVLNSVLTCGGKQEGGNSRGGALLTHLAFVEFQYTTCLLATAADMMFRRKTVAFQTGRAPGVRTSEPMLTAARGRAEAPAGRGAQTQTTGEKIRRGEKKHLSSSCFTNSETNFKKKGLYVT